MITARESLLVSGGSLPVVCDIIALPLSAPFTQSGYRSESSASTSSIKIARGIWGMGWTRAEGLCFDEIFDVVFSCRWHECWLNLSKRARIALQHLIIKDLSGRLLPDPEGVPPWKDATSWVALSVGSGCNAVRDDNEQLYGLEQKLRHTEACP